MLTSLQNPLIKQMRKLHQGKYRRAQQQFLLEGTHLLLEAVETGYPLEVICCTPQWQAKQAPEWLAQLEQLTRLEVVSEQVLAAIATTVNPDGVVALAPFQPRPPLEIHHLGLAVETLQDPGNLGTIIRTAAAAGAEGVLLSSDSVELENPKVLRATAGQWFRLPLSVAEDFQAELQHYRQQGIQVVATLPQAQSNYWDVDLTCPTLFLLGNEGAGLSASVVALADRQVKIPLQPGVESLNVAIAAALLLYESQRQRQSRT